MLSINHIKSADVRKAGENEIAAGDFRGVVDLHPVAWHAWERLAVRAATCWAGTPTNSGPHSNPQSTIALHCIRTE